ncbi:MFS transporter [Hyphomonas sp.]|uniref:MFS transporter n=1 Tax=Hyphomonas sp. TaxID=87 RepID=UPI0030F8916C
MSFLPAFDRNAVRAWLVVVAAMVGVSVGLSPIPFYTIGMFAPQLSEAFGWSFSSLMGSIAVQSIVVMIVSPFAGYAVDRFGARKVATVSLTCFGLCFMSLSLNNGSLAIFYAQWVVMAVLGAGTLSATWTYVVNGWFDKNRGLALGLASAGTGITGFLIKPFAAWLIGEFGWRTAFVAIGMLPIVVGLPVILLFLRERRFSEDAAVLPDEGAVDEVVQIAAGYTLREVLRQKNFWVMSTAFLLIAFALTAPTPNLENILRTQGFALAEIGTITASFGLAVIAGRLLGGWLLDRAWAPLCAFFILLIPAAGCYILSLPEVDSTMAFIAVAGIGFGAGFEFDLLAYLISRYFGLRQYGLIYGCFYAVIAFGGGLGPVVYGHFYDTLGNYTMTLTGGTLAVILGGALLLLLGRYPDFKANVRPAQV